MLREILRQNLVEVLDGCVEFKKAIGSRGRGGFYVSWRRKSALVGGNSDEIRREGGGVQLPW